MGVWIETHVSCIRNESHMSHPTWVCGLKLQWVLSLLWTLLSHPTWVCGLKQISKTSHNDTKLSHPTWVCGLKHTHGRLLSSLVDVTPYVGVWIETMSMEVFPGCTIVTPYVGVWIETWMCNIYKLYEKSHPTWVCGLKL